MTTDDATEREKRQLTHEKSARHARVVETNGDRTRRIRRRRTLAIGATHMCKTLCMRNTRTASNVLSALLGWVKMLLNWERPQI